MANNVRAWSTTASSNGTADADINAAEGCPPSVVNDDIRYMMAKVKNTLTGVEYLDWGHTATYASATTFATPGDLSAVYLARRRLKFDDSSTLYGTIVSSSYVASNTTVTVVMDSGSLSASLSAAYLGFAPTNLSAPANFNKEAYATTAGTTTAYTAAFTPKNVALTNGVNVRIKLDQTCGATPTLAVDGLTAKTIVKAGNSAVASGDLTASSVLDLTYDSTLDKWVIQGAGGGAPGLSSSLITADPATAAKDTLYGCNTTSAAFTVTMPASPSNGDKFFFDDAGGTWHSNNLTIDPNGNTINGVSGSLTVNVRYASFGLVFWTALGYRIF